MALSLFGGFGALFAASFLEKTVQLPQGQLS